LPFVPIRSTVRPEQLVTALGESTAASASSVSADLTSQLAADLVPNLLSSL
jgi:hypothetical protein